jgi:putative DNA primase/helicase
VTSPLIDHRDLVIEALADSEATLRSRLAEAESETALAAAVIAESCTQPEYKDDRLVPPPTEPMAVARELAKALYTDSQDRLLLRDYRGDFYRWNGSCWPEIDKRDVRAAAYQWLEHAKFTQKTQLLPFAPTSRKISDVIDAIRGFSLIDSASETPAWTGTEAEPSASEIVSMTNGLLHVPTRKLLPHTPAFFTRHALPFAYEPDAPQPELWLNFLRELWPDDLSSIAALQETIGYILAGDTRLQKIFLLVGPKRAGKGTIGRVVTNLLGAHNVAAPTLASLSTNFGLSPLIGKPLALISDARLGGKADGQIVVERLLSISGEDSLTIDRKYRDPWTGRLSTRFMVLTNELPRLTDSSGALASRFVVFVLTRSFYGSENPSLTHELLNEASGIFNWGLQGLDRLMARGFFENPTSGKDAIQQLEDLSSPISAFVRDICTLGPYQVDVEALWTAWKAWCEGDNRHAGTKALFGRDLRAAVPTLKRIRPRGEERRYAYEGIGLRDDVVRRVLGPSGSPEGNGPSGPRTSTPQAGPAREVMEASADVV